MKESYSEILMKDRKRSGKVNVRVIVNREQMINEGSTKMVWMLGI